MLPNATTVHPPSQAASTSDHCNVIRPGDASLAANWENIPETLLLNFSIGLVLFILFLLLTWIAWRRADSDDKLQTQNIVNFLYGYRDPEQWYVIPRFEFLRHEDRHHKHDMNYPYIYVPPKLPMANPLDLFAEVNPTKSVDSGSQDRTGTTATKLPNLTQSNNNSSSGSQNNSHDKPSSPTDQAAPKSPESTLTDSPIRSARTVPPASPPNRSTYSEGNLQNSSDAPRRDTLQSGVAGNSFFYPSILTAEQLQASYLSRKLNRFFSMFFRVSDADIIYARGIDAYEYLLFQRHLILIMLVTSVLCVGVILPLHWVAGGVVDTKQLYSTSFQRSTIKNIHAKSHLHWVHVVCSALIVLTTVKVMGSYKDSIMTQDDDAQISRRTLLIGNIPTEQRTRPALTKVFQDYFSQNNIEAIQFVYDTRSLVDDEMYLSSTIVAKDYCLAYKRKLNSEIYVHRTDVNQSRTCDGYCRCCSFVYISCCFWPYESKEPGSLYYAKEEEKFRKKIAATCEKLIREPAEYAFVTFKSYKQARRVLSELATMKQEALEGKHQGVRSLSRQARSAGGLSRRGSRHRQLDAEEKLVRSKPKFLESALHNGSKDPLDPSNNPHVRSIRSPIKLSGTKVTTTGNSSDAQHLDESTALKALTATAKAAALEQAHRSRSRNILGNPFRKADSSSGVPLKKLEGPIMWSVRYAPHPDNVEFDDLLNLSSTSKYTIFLLHFLMVLIFVFITTPNVILSMIERISVLQPDKAVQLTGFQGLAINYLSILIQIIATAILPALITLISKQIPYEDSSTKGHSMMWKVYAFLILMVIIMPSIGMSSAQALFESDLKPKCLFPTDNGAYYINYVVSSIFLSTILELIKPLDILSYYFILWTSRSTAEIESGRQFIDREFSVGMQHTGVLLIFSVVMTYSISCPLIAPVGLVYLCVKHAVDHYNLYYSYFTKKVDKDLQSTIVVFVKVALILMLFQTTVAIYINTGTSYFSLLSQMIFWITLATLGFNCFFDCTARTQPTSKRPRYRHEFCACFYLPKVIASLLRSDAIPPNCISRKV